MRIVIDAMGGDFGATPIVEGVILALQEREFTALLVGKEDEILPLIPIGFKDKILVIDAQDVISMSDKASDSLKRKNSSIYKAIDLVKSKEADAVVSAGHSGATMSLATLRIGRIKGISRPAIATLMPTTNDGKTLVLDVGANVDCKSEHLFEFALMGELYTKRVLHKDSPKVGLLSNGEESSKGNEVTKEVYKLLSSNPNFIGNVEGNNIFDGSCDVVVCDGFIGNILLKTSEGIADSIIKILKTNISQSFVAKVGALLMGGVFKLLKKRIDYAEYGGAPLLGVDGCVVICHGKSNSKAIKNAVFQAIDFTNSGVNDKIKVKLNELS